jgi:hypothetical protein
MFTLPAFQPDKCRCRTGGLNKKKDVPNFVGTQCRFAAGENGLCSQHKPDHKFGFYDEPRPTIWGFTHDGRHIPLPASEENKRGKPIPWKKNIIFPEQRITSAQSAQSAHQESECSKYFSELRDLKEITKKFISDKEKEIVEQKQEIDILKKKLEESNKRAGEAESKSLALQLTLDKRDNLIKDLKNKLSGVLTNILSKDEEGIKNTGESEDELQEDKYSYDEIDFEGVSYIEDEETGKIYNTQYQYVGKWNSDIDNIIWSSEEFKNSHESARH